MTTSSAWWTIGLRKLPELHDRPWRHRAFLRRSDAPCNKQTFLGDSRIPHTPEQS
ncbi:hypothetical protein J2Z21_000628 [Streptomyces griseochromogenes]|uniref:Uncharacterized protein n=1 Tax=Streptomyces griseochromogenes TaxID=68214 RepID=A0ABS4LK05_9ACTN|nr:hypothetical protein [Streptomyces griseochromogenes]MBP2047706.1 hypothetical protein [Streptomyces griseochromogenes]